jgi:murein DD-endopeptidase MepM/ murein hydrolase activator NlpD
MARQDDIWLADLLPKDTSNGGGGGGPGPLLLVPIVMLMFLFGGITTLGSIGAQSSQTNTASPSAASPTPSSASADGPASAYAKANIPANILAIDQSDRVKQECPGLSWMVVAAITHVESGDGANTGPSSAGAMGPDQFLPSTWDSAGQTVVKVSPNGDVPNGQGYGVDGDGDGLADINNPADSIPAAAHYLCANGGGNPATVGNAIYQYNHAWWYVYGGAVPGGGTTIGVLPLAKLLADPVVKTTSGWSVPLEGKFYIYQPFTWNGVSGHPGDDLEHNSDIFGRPILAAHSGVITVIQGDSKCGNYVSIDLTENNQAIDITNCHMSMTASGLVSGMTVTAGQIIGYVGSTGDSTGPHLHFQIKINGAVTNPVPFMLERGIDLTAYNN